jgi:hypothetical protein
MNRYDSDSYTSEFELNSIIVEVMHKLMNCSDFISKNLEKKGIL